MIRALTPNQARIVDRLREFGDRVAVDDAAFDRRWRETLGKRRLTVEVGCADATLLARVAAARPAEAFIGLDWKYADVLRAADRVRVAGLTNVGLIRGRAQDLRRLFAAGDVDELWLFHPEPVGDRLFAEPFLVDAASVLRDESSTLVLKTDHAGYYQAALATLGHAQPDWPIASPRARMRDLAPTLPPASDAARAAFEVACASADFWRDAAAQAHVAARAFAGERSPFEQRFVDRRRPIFYLELRRTGLVSPAPHADHRPS